MICNQCQHRPSPECKNRNCNLYRIIELLAWLNTQPKVIWRSK